MSKHMESPLNAGPVAGPYYTSGDGRDVASGDEYHAGYEVVARMPTTASASELAHMFNLRELGCADADEAWRLVAALVYMRANPGAAVTIRPDGVSCQSC